MMYDKMSAVLLRWKGETSYSEIARRTGAGGMSVSGVSDIIQGKTVPRAETLEVLVQALGHTQADLVREMAEA